MPARDQQIDWGRKRAFLPAPSLQGTMAGSGAATPVGADATAPITAEVNSLGFLAVLFDAEGEIYHHWCKLPYDLDVEHPLYVRTCFASPSTTDADGFTWIVTYSHIPADGTVIAGATALDTPIVEVFKGAGAAYSIQYSSWGKANGGTFAFGDFVTFKVEIDATDSDITNTEKLLYFGLELEYTPKMCVGIGQSYEASRLE